MGYAPETSREYPLWQFAFVFLCVISWGSEAVICSYAMRTEAILSEIALQIRQFTSSVFYAFILLPVFGAWNLTFQVVHQKISLLFLITSFAVTCSYLMYYKSIHIIGPSKAMALNITYIVWSILFSLILFKNIPRIKDLICALLILIGSILASHTPKHAETIYKYKKENVV